MSTGRELGGEDTLALQTVKCKNKTIFNPSGFTKTKKPLGEKEANLIFQNDLLQKPSIIL